MASSIDQLFRPGMPSYSSRAYSTFLKVKVLSGARFQAGGRGVRDVTARASDPEEIDLDSGLRHFRLVKCQHARGQRCWVILAYK